MCSCLRLSVSVFVYVCVGFYAPQSTVHSRSRMVSTGPADHPRSRSVDRGASRAGSVISTASTLRPSLPVGASLTDKLRIADDIIAEQKRVIAEKDLALWKQQEDLRYRARRMAEMERQLREQGQQLADLRTELSLAQSARQYKGSRPV
jgi:hypothetical protein